LRSHNCSRCHTGAHFQCKALARQKKERKKEKDRPTKLKERKKKEKKGLLKLHLLTCELMPPEKAQKKPAVDK